MNFIFGPSLVLHLPLYELDGTSFMSKDADGHLCAVSGALWRPNGRYFDGVDDKITFPDTNLPSGSGNRTVLGWFNSTGLGSNDRIFSYGTYTTDQLFDLQLSSHLDVIGGTNNYAGTKTLSVSTWYHFAVVVSGSNIKSYINLESDIDTTHSLNTTLSGTAIIGDSVRGAVHYWYNNLIGELSIYSRALNPLEIQHNYLATKWRYR